MDRGLESHPALTGIPNETGGGGWATRAISAYRRKSEHWATGDKPVFTGAPGSLIAFHGGGRLPQTRS